MLLALKPIGVKGGCVHFLFRCDCGKEKIIAGHHATSGRQASCGCLHPQKHHGHSRSPEYQIWRHIIKRCTDPKNIGYANYGGRGIRVCERWLESVENFIADMGHRPSKRHSVDRRENDGDYCPDNCYWALPKQQHRNTRRSHIIEWNGKTATIAEWAEITGFNYTTILHRLQAGWPIEKALTKPCQRYRKSSSSYWEQFSHQAAQAPKPHLP